MFNYDWKGNVRQLKNVVESLVVMDTDNLLGLDDLSPDLSDEQIEQNLQPTNLAGDGGFLIGQSLKDIERWAIEKTLTIANHNREETARILGISERNLYRKLNEYGLGKKK